jgi:hypothetical protein
MALGIGGRKRGPGAHSGRANLLGAITGISLFMLGLAIAVQPAPARAATRVITVTPDTGLAAGQTITVSWSGFSPFSQVQTIFIQECKQQITDLFADCAILTLVSPDNGTDGSGSVQFPVLSRNPNGQPFDEGFTCDATNPCAITARESFDNADNSLVSHNVAFAAAATTTTHPGATTTTTPPGPTTTSQPGGTTTTAPGETTTTRSGETTTTTPGQTTTSAASTTTTTGSASTTTLGGATTTSVAPTGTTGPGGSGGGSGGGNLPFTGAAAHLPLVALIGIASTLLGAGVRWYALSQRFGGPAS